VEAVRDHRAYSRSVTVDQSKPAGTTATATGEGGVMIDKAFTVATVPFDLNVTVAGMPIT
jgi:hypothetical protein